MLIVNRILCDDIGYKYDIIPIHLNNLAASFVTHMSRLNLLSWKIEAKLLKERLVALQAATSPHRSDAVRLYVRKKSSKKIEVEATHTSWESSNTSKPQKIKFGHFCSHPLMHEYSWIRRFPFFNAKHRGFAPMTFSISTSQRSDPQKKKKKKKTLLTGIQMKPCLSWTSTGWQGYPTISYISHMKVPFKKTVYLQPAVVFSKLGNF